jgi:AraC family transcriptional regulator
VEKPTVNPVEAALWFVESHLKDETSLDGIADVAGVSRFHLTRAFGLATGLPVMRYVRARRLTEAARALARCDGDILAVALEFGYGSHEAFTRAFRDQFGVTPQHLRNSRRLDDLNLLEAIRMKPSTTVATPTPRIVDRGAFLVAGIAKTHRGSNAGMPAQWGEFVPHLGHIRGQCATATYGVLYNDTEASIDYLTAVEVTDFADLPDTFTHLRIAPQQYAVFRHEGHVATIGATWEGIWSSWFPQSGRQAADAPMFERYPETFDAHTGNGGFEIWIPLES